MWPSRYYPGRYFARRYFPAIGGVISRWAQLLFDAFSVKSRNLSTFGATSPGESTFADGGHRSTLVFEE